MKNITFIFFYFILNVNTSILSAQTLVFAQNENYPLYTNVDSIHIDTFSFSTRDENYNSHINIVNLRAYKSYLKPFVEQNDPYALYLYGSCHCDIVNESVSFEGIPRPVYYDTKNLPDTTGISIDTSMAFNRIQCVKYLEQAGDLNMAWANWELYSIYRHDELPAASIDYSLALDYLNKAEKTGDNYIKNLVYTILMLAHLPDSTETGVNPSFPLIEYNIDIGLAYAVKAIEYSGYPEDNGHNRYLAILFEDYGKYDTALEYQLKIEDSPYITMRAAAALIRGGFSNDALVERDKNRGVKIIHALLDKVIAQGNQEVADELIEWFNELHSNYCLLTLSQVRYCEERPITKEDLGKYLIE